MSGGYEEDIFPNTKIDIVMEKFNIDRKKARLIIDYINELASAKFDRWQTNYIKLHEKK